MSFRRNRRAGVEDRWYRTVRDPDGTERRIESATHGKGMRWRARYVDDLGREHAKGFARKVDAQQWLDGQTSALVQGTHVAPRDAQLTVQQWCDRWLEGYAVHRDGTVRSAKVHLAQITAEFGALQLAAVRPSAVKSWTARLKADGHKDSYVYALHGRLSQVLGDAVHDGLLPRNPCSRRTSPPMGKPKVYCATTEQVWALHEAVEPHLQSAILLGAFAGLRVSEVSALNRFDDVDFTRGVVHPKRQWPDRPLKTKGSDAPIPVPRELTLMLSACAKQFPGEWMVTNLLGEPVPPWQIERAIRDAREKVPGLPVGFSFHDLRHYLASLLIAKGGDIKTVQARLRHANAKTTLDTYGHLWPDADESTRLAIGSVITERMDSIGSAADALRTEGE